LLALWGQPLITSTSNNMIKEEHSPAQPPEPRSLRPFRRFLLLLLLIPALVYIAMFPLAMIPALGFDRWGGSRWAPVLNFGFHADHQNADVVIFGDSSAAAGVDPRLVDAELGIRSIVLPNTLGSLPVTGDMALRRYLEHNTRPRLIVFYFSPWDLDYDRPGKDKFLFEGEQMLLRNGSWHDIASFARRHPLALLAFPWQANSMLGVKNVWMTLRTDRQRDTAQAQGHIDYNDPIGPMHTPCEIPVAYLNDRSSSSVQQVVRRYAARDLHVAVYLAPIPACNNAREITSRTFSELGAAPPATLPATSFAADGLFAHVLPPFVPESSRLLASTLRSRPELAQKPQPASR